MKLKSLTLVFLSVWISRGNGDNTAECKVARNPVGDYNDTITGTVTLTQTGDGDTRIELDLSGFYTGDGSVVNRGFHVHQNGVIGENGCSDTGGHYNPEGVDHGARDAQVRHVGDLGNIAVSSSTHKSTIDDSVVSLSGDNSVIGLAIVIHEGTDDLGLGGDEGSRTTGNAGRRSACCIIEDTSSSAVNIKVSLLLTVISLLTFINLN